MKNRFLGAILLVAGTAIGAGMLGLPIITGFCGFCPSFLVIVACWAFLLMTAFIILDVNLSMEGEVNIISMAEKTLGKWGKVVAWTSNLFLLYALEVAFMAGGSQILKDLLPFPSWIFPLLILCPLGMVIVKGMRIIDKVNRIFMIGKLGVGYVILICFVPSHVKFSLLSHADFSPLLFTLPIVIQSFCFHAVIPSLVNYLDRDAKKLRMSIFLGSLISLIVYGLWEFLVLGVVPVVGEISLSNAWANGSVSTAPLIEVLHVSVISTGAVIFALFAVGTAFLGVSLGLFDFLIDGLKMKKDLKGKSIAFASTFIPSLIFVYTCERVFIGALEYAGAFVAVISGIIPICMAWTLPKPSFWRSSSGRVLLIGSGVFFSLVVILDVLSKMGYLQPLIQRYIS